MLRYTRLVAGAWCIVAVGGLIAMTGCASQLHRAPVEDRTVGGRAPQPFVPPAGTAVAAAPPAAARTTEVAPPRAEVSAPRAAAAAPVSVAENAEFAGKPGYYTVKAGDTLLRVALETGQNWRDIQRWNGLDNAHVLQVGEVLRVVPPNQDPAAVVTRAVSAAPAANEAPPVRVAAAAPLTAAATASTAVVPQTAPTLATPSPPAAAPAGASAAAPGSDDDLGWIWPVTAGAVFAPFDEAKNKGMLIGGNAGDPVMATADGEVVYAGSGLRGYGNLVIIKHNNTYLSVYAHNKVLLVRENQSVKRGQKIAEMGSSDASRVQLHFEVRKQGKPIDPARVLPPR